MVQRPTPILFILSHKSFLSNRPATETLCKLHSWGRFYLRQCMVSRIHSQIPEGRGCESMCKLPAGLGWSPPAAKVCRRPFCFSAEIWTIITKWITFKECHSGWSEILRIKCNYRQGSEWCAAVGVVFDIMTNNQSIHDLREKKKKSSNRQFQSKRLAGKKKLRWINENWVLAALTGLWLECPLVISSNGLHSWTNHSGPKRRAAAQSRCFRHNIHNAKTVQLYKKIK